MKPFNVNNTDMEEEHLSDDSRYRMIRAAYQRWSVHNKFLYPRLGPFPTASQKVGSQQADSTPVETLEVIDLDDIDDFGDRISQSQRSATSYALRNRAGRAPIEYAYIDEGNDDSEYQAEHKTPHSSTQQLSDPTDKEDCCYKLIGVTAHRGGANAGHYVSYIRNDTTTRNNWFLYNDTKVSKTWCGRLPKDLFGSKRTTNLKPPDNQLFAYLLFYKKYHPPPEELLTNPTSESDSDKEPLVQNNVCIDTLPSNLNSLSLDPADSTCTVSLATDTPHLSTVFFGLSLFFNSRLYSGNPVGSRNSLGTSLLLEHSNA